MEPSEGMDEQSPVEVRADQLLQADPQTILRIRKKIQTRAVAQQAPIVDDYSDEIPQEVLDLEDIFEISLQPDQAAPKVLLSRGQSTAISFIDAYGKPWPIRKISNFLNGRVLIDRAIPDVTQGQNPDANPDSKDGINTDNTLKDPQAGSFTITALKHGVAGNITVYLYGLSTPISINLVGKGNVFHRVATMKVSDVGPQTDPIEILKDRAVSIGTESDVDLNNALYGVTPSGSEPMVVQGAEGKAWIKGKFLYLQTPLAVFSPQILGASTGSSRFKAYKLPLTTTVMGTNNEGATIVLKVLRHPSTDINESNSFGNN